MSPDRARVGELFEPFGGINALLYNEDTRSKWLAAIAEHGPSARHRLTWLRSSAAAAAAEQLPISV